MSGRVFTASARALVQLARIVKYMISPYYRRGSLSGCESHRCDDLRRHTKTDTWDVPWSRECNVALDRGWADYPRDDAQALLFRTLDPLLDRESAWMNWRLDDDSLAARQLTPEDHRDNSWWRELWKLACSEATGINLSYIHFINKYFTVQS